MPSDSCRELNLVCRLQQVNKVYLNELPSNNIRELFIIALLSLLMLYFMSAPIASKPWKKSVCPHDSWCNMTRRHKPGPNLAWLSHMPLQKDWVNFFFFFKREKVEDLHLISKCLVSGLCPAGWHLVRALSLLRVAAHRRGIQFYLLYKHDLRNRSFPEHFRISKQNLTSWCKQRGLGRERGQGKRKATWQVSLAYCNLGTHSFKKRNKRSQ